MKAQRKIVLIVSIAMAVIGAVVLVAGLLAGPSLVPTVFGGFMVVAAILAYKSGSGYIDDQENENEK